MSRRRLRLATLGLTLTLALGGCRATGRTANSYFDWGGRTFTTNPISFIPYWLGFIPFFIAGIPLDLITWPMAAIGWPEGKGDDYVACALAPSFFLGTTGGILLGAPFWPLGLPWWDPEREDHEAPKDEPKRKDTPAPIAPTHEAPGPSAPEPSAPDRDPGDIPAGAPRR